MDATVISLGMLFLVQISTGVSVNGFLLLFYAHLASVSPKFSSSDVILTQLTLDNTIVLLTLGIPETMSAWGWRNFLGDVGCKILNYLYHVARGLAICTTCLLSVFQAITISPGTSCWAGVKAKLPKCIVPCCLLSWILNLLIEFDTLMNMTGPQNSNSVQIMLDLKYCTKVSYSAEINLVIAVIFSVRDLFFVGLMSVASSYVVFTLNRHRRQVQHLHRSDHPHKAMPEVRAAKRVVALVTLYVLLYGRRSIMLSIIIHMKEEPFLLLSHEVLSFTFSFISPFLLIHSDRRKRAFWKKESSVSHTDPS
ncbi:olfactory receptor class A-like protein 1 [Tachyglossus aculeatus]|uniref:olfactory receptor class A-like protein 1 n=1 Tax=Tachyglossus aculeatus TaxID=9261 RepID=UPI0018F6F3A0|nr:olfactory receptor class A-like protein 1 [Tachyglossus aculeatus]